MTRSNPGPYWGQRARPGSDAIDPDDDHVIAAAVTDHADVIATGDKRELQPLGIFQGIDIVSAREVVERPRAKGKT